MTLTYAGIPLSVATPKLALAIERAISPRDVYSWQRLDWPGPACDRWTYPGRVPESPLRIGCLNWPQGAARWATGFFLCSDNQLAAIRNIVSTTTYAAYPLVLSWEDQTGTTIASVSPQMWMLPPRPLFQIDGANGLNLCTFVDERYFWWFRDTGDVIVTAGTTTWVDLYTALQTALGVTITVEAPDAAYLTPASVLTSRYNYSPLMLDAVAYNVGQRIVRDWDTGEVYAYGPTTSAGVIDDNLAGDWPVMGGGAFALDPGQLNDLAALLPGRVQVTFPQAAAGVATGDVYAVTQTLPGLGLADLGATGNANAKTFHDACAAVYTAGAQPANAAALEALTKQIATDWYRQQLAPVEAKFVGIVPWQVEGLSDAIEWTYRKGEVSTRIYRPPWNDLTEQLLHGPDAAAPPAWVKITSATPATITLPGGATVSGYPAKVDTWLKTSGTWGDSSDPVWFLGANSETPANGTRYQCRLLGVDDKGVSVWATVIDAGVPGGALELLDKSGGVVDPACAVLQMDTRGVVTLTSFGGGYDQFVVADAGAAQQGVVNITTQSFAGSKTFLNAQTWMDGIANCTETICWTGSGSNGHGGVSTLAYPNLITGPLGFAWQDSGGGTFITDFQFSSTGFVGTNYSLLTIAGNGSSSGLFLVVNDDLVQGQGGGVATNAVHGFLYISTCAGTPTGTPKQPALGGYAPMLYDTTGGKLWIWNPVSLAWTAH